MDDDNYPLPASYLGHHIGRSWTSHHLEDGCPCLKADCGLVITDTIDPGCPEHHWKAAKSMRQSHQAETCPGPGEHARVEK